jgi:hypothetical protein
MHTISSANLQPKFWHKFIFIVLTVKSMALSYMLFSDIHKTSPIVPLGGILDSNPVKTTDLAAS